MEARNQRTRAAVATGALFALIFMLVGSAWGVATITGWFYALYHWTPDSFKVWWTWPAIIAYALVGCWSMIFAYIIWSVGWTEAKRQTEKYKN